MATERTIDVLDPRNEEALKQLDIRIDEAHIGTEPMQYPYDRHAYVTEDDDLYVYFDEDEEYRQITFEGDIEPSVVQEAVTSDIVTHPISIDRINLIGYRELTHSAGKLIKEEVWEDSTKALKLITRDITWNGALVDYVDVSDHKDGSVLRKQFTYAGVDLLNVSETSLDVGDSTYNWDMPLSDGEGNILLFRGSGEAGAVSGGGCDSLTLESPTQVDLKNFTTANNYVSGKLAVFLNGVKEKYITEVGVNQFAFQEDTQGTDIVECLYVKQ